jgi:hypothetical protein
MHTKRFRFRHRAIALATAAFFVLSVHAQASDSHGERSWSKDTPPAQGPLPNAVRDSTKQFKGISAAEAAGYHLLFGCVSGPDFGAMGLHYVNMDLVGNPPLGADGQPDPTRPQILVYEPQTDGTLRLVGDDYLIIAQSWDAAHPGQGAPQVMGQLMQYIPAPNRYGLPAVYILHVWAWRYNPKGAFAMWNPNVSCNAYAGQAK